MTHGIDGANDDADELFPADWQPTPRPDLLRPLEELTPEEAEALNARWSKRRTRQPGAAKKRRPEAAVMKKIERFFDQRGILYRRVNSGFWRDEEGNVIAGAPAGTSDYLALVPIEIGGYTFGVFFAVEAKAPGGKPTPLQDKFLDNVRKRGGVGVVASSALDIENAINAKTQEMLTLFARLAGLLP